MKIPQIVATYDIGEPPAPRVDAEAWGAPFTALSRAGTHLAHVSAEIAAVNDRIKADQARDQATDMFSTVGQQVEALRESARQPASKDNPYGVPDGEPVSKSYVERFTTGYDALVKDQLGKTDDPTVQHYLGRRLLHLKAEALTHVQKDQWAMAKDEKIAGLPVRMETFRSLAIANPAARETTMQEANAFLDSYQGDMKASAIAEMKHKFKQDVNYGLAKRAIDADPFDAKTTEYETALSPENVLKLQEYTLVAQQKRAAAEKRAQDRLEEEIKKQRTVTFANLTDRALQGLLTEDDARSDPGWQWLEGGQREHITTMIRTPKVLPSDAQTRQQVINRAYLSRPQMTEGEVVALNKKLGPNGSPLLNDADTITALTWIRERGDYWRGQAKTDAHHADDQQRHVAEREQSYLDHTIDTALSVTGSIAERLDPKAQELKSIAREQMFNRSRTFRGKEDPQAVMYDILPGLMERLADGPDGIKDDYGKIQRIIDLSPYKTQEALNAAVASGKVTPAQELEARRHFQQLVDAKRTYDSLQAQIKQMRDKAQSKAKK